MREPQEITKQDLQEKTEEELNALLREDIFNTEDTDFTWLEQILEELEARAQGTDRAVDTQAARARFDALYSRLDEPLYPGEAPEEPAPVDRLEEASRSGRRKPRKWLRVLVAAVLLAVLVAVPVAGQDGFVQFRSGWQAEDSPQIKGQIMESLTGEDGEIVLWYYVSGRGQVKALGAEEITVWRKVDGLWLEAVRYDRNTPGLWAEGVQDFGGKVIYRGLPGEYQVEITVFAENERGYDTRSKLLYVTIEEEAGS